MNLPNKLTVFRVALIPVFLLFYFVEITKYHMFIALIIFIVAALTDALDGHIARKHNLVTNFGKLMDPLADKLLVTAAMVCVLGYSLPSLEPHRLVFYIISLIVIISRDLIVNSIRLVAAGEGTVIAADIFGKVKTVLQMVWASFALLYLALLGLGSTSVYVGYLADINFALFIAVVVMTVFSGTNYIVKNKSVFADA